MLYLLTDMQPSGYDCMVSCVVAANSEAEARRYAETNTATKVRGFGSKRQMH